MCPWHTEYFWTWQWGWKSNQVLALTLRNLLINSGFFVQLLPKKQSCIINTLLQQTKSNSCNQCYMTRTNYPLPPQSWQFYVILYLLESKREDAFSLKRYSFIWITYEKYRYDSVTFLNVIVARWSGYSYAARDLFSWYLVSSFQNKCLWKHSFYGLKAIGSKTGRPYKGSLINGISPYSAFLLLVPIKSITSM